MVATITVKNVKKIALIFAMEAEAQPLIEALRLSPVDETRLPFRYFTGTYRGLEIAIAYNGKDSRFDVDLVGTEPAAVNAFATIEKFHPDVLISAGTAGALPESGAQIGEVFLSRKFSYHDHRIPLPGWREFGLGNYPSFDVEELSEEVGARVEGISTRNSLDFNPDDLANMRANGAMIEDMESAAIAWVCFITQTKFFAIKAVSNLITDDASIAEDFENNLKETVRCLRDKTIDVLDALA